MKQKTRKWCNGCSRLLAVRDFHKQKKSLDGLHCRCRECRGVKKRFNKTIKERLAENMKVSRISGCWEWTGETNEFGYGRMNVSGKKKVVHRIAYAEFVEEVPKEMFLCHKCDNPKCFNPFHLFVGNQKDNMEDMRRKGRAGKKLTADDVKKILRSSDIDAQLARDFKVNQATIHAIKNGHTWKHIERV